MTTIPRGETWTQLAGDLGLGDSSRVWQADWPLSEPSYEPGALFFLTPAFWEDAGRKLRMESAALAALQRAAAGILANHSLQRLAWHCHWMLYHSGRDQVAAAGGWPALPETLGEAGGLFYAVVCLSGLDILQQRCAKRQIPAAVVYDTLMDVELWMHHWHRRLGRWHFDRMNWLSLHCQGRLFRLGRLQFELTTWSGDFRVLRHDRSGAVVVLAGEGSCFDEAGQFACEGQGGWRARCVEEGGVIRGHPISPRGYALREPVELPAKEWRVALESGAAALGVHIPASGPMEHEACGESFRAAMEFFPRHFPEHDFRAFTSGSWLFDCQLEDHLPGESNIVRFLREFYLLPMPGASDFQTWERVFGGPVANLDSAPQDTALRRAVVRHARAGGKWRTANMLLLREDLQWGRQVYRRDLPRG